MDSGVRAEPKFLRDPTSLESISSGISRLSSYVASNLPKRKSTHLITPPFMDPYYQQPVIEPEEQANEEMEEMDIVTFGAFETLDPSISCLLLGYHDGFQIWDVTNPDNVHEICSIRDKDTFGTVSFMHLVQPNHTLVIVSTEDSSDKPKSHLILFSLKTQTIIKEIHDFWHEEEEKDDTAQVTCIQSNHKVIALGCVSRHRSLDYTPFARPLNDVYHDDKGPVFTLGSRFIAYATNTAVLNSDPVMTSLTNKSISYTGFGVLQGEKDVKGAAKDIAKEVVSGMKTLGEFGLNTLSNYFNPNVPTDKMMFNASPSSHTTPQQDTQYNPKKMIPSGMIMIRDMLKLPVTPTRNLSSSMIAHFRPHTHPVSCLKFNQAGTLLMSASKQGHTFHIFSVLTYTPSASHLYSLSRGITDAQVEDCQFSMDSTWCAISTARGTTHVYAINPYGGKPEISGHVHGKVNNPMHHHPWIPKNHKSSIPKATTLSSVVRIKQRRSMPGFLQEEVANKYPNGYSHGYYGPTPPHYVSALPRTPPTPSLKEPRAKLRSMFVTKSPSFVHHKHAHPSDHPFVSMKQQASHMLSSFHLPYLPQQPQPHKSAHETLVFGFDEEYDDAAKMINDEIGYQDMYSFHPDGVLTLHRCWVAKTVIKKRENGRVLEKLDLSLKEEDVAEWRVARNADWDQVKFNKKKPKQQESLPPKKTWLSNAEITTYMPDEPALWTYHQFSFQTYHTKDLPSILNAGNIPTTDTMIMLKGMPEPVSSRMDRVSKTTTRITNNNAEENMEDALAELEDNISKAMQTSFSPSSNSLGNSPAANLKWLSSSANAIHGSSPSPNQQKLYLDKNSSVSFEDAYLIHMGSGPSPEPSSLLGLTPIQNQPLEEPETSMQHSSLIQFDEDEDEGSVQLKASHNVYSPDGDNEVEYPYESVFGELHTRKEEEEEEEENGQSISW
ncbi:uncharacterized protein B0P05DRAFT_559344 [Gilbertella persicaria]|uniref:uncharacterized protein n=1 Tax=Gilbertella persicaria TaxID=101096 RepID=UPI0022208EB4|nr:uncharacterized protein B0P05DRAFT_559344 [Gilbertella persicaria]KAI8058653.1 hypothetical protein B0P05DRAFT_559344 [Gilbertella persicaria]